ncbi:hypothetical protein K458DRAFT_411950, partial [Lentithecium fluviatile CBS 122367]
MPSTGNGAHGETSPYFLPVNQAEAERLMMQHSVLIDALDNRLVCAPIDSSRPGLKVLDSGTTDGHWIRELRSRIANSELNTYVGTDLNPKLFPESVPPDTRFYVHNISEPWPKEEHGTFDFVHQRLTLPGGAPTPLPQVLKHLFDLVKPGGWIQLVEAEQTGPESGPVFHEFLSLVRALFNATGAGCDYAAHMKEWLRELGAVDLYEIRVNMAFGAKNEKPKLAEGSARCTAQAMDGLILHAKACNSLRTDISEAQMDTLGVRLHEELMKVGAIYPLRIVWGRKLE